MGGKKILWVGWPWWKAAGFKERNAHPSYNKFHKLSLAKKSIVQLFTKLYFLLDSVAWKFWLNLWFFFKI